MDSAVLDQLRRNRPVERADGIIIFATGELVREWSIDAYHADEG